MAEDIASCCVGVARLCHDLDVGLRLEHHPDAVANQLVVVGEHDRDRLDGLWRSGLGHAVTIGANPPGRCSAGQAALDGASMAEAAESRLTVASACGGSSVRSPRFTTWSLLR